MADHIRYETDGGLVTTTIDRPEVHNAFRRRTILEFNDMLRDAATDDGFTSSF